MRTPLIAGNWKMNGTRARAAELAGAVARRTAALHGVEVAIMPPFVHLESCGQALAGSQVKLGAQNVSDQDPGAFTGEVSGDMLADLGCIYALVGHSERRQYYREDDEFVARRFSGALRYGLTPVLCVGETLADRESGATESVLRAQLSAVIDLCGAPALASGVIAYEPVWAIGTGRSATPEQAQSAHALIRAVVTEHGADASVMRVLYGGSLKPGTAAELLTMPDVDGGLIGGASLDADAFAAIAAAAAH